MRTVVVIQARMGSTRLPGKVLARIGGRPMIAHVIERATSIHGADAVVAAIPDLAEDDPLAEVLGSLDTPVVRGPMDDVLSRYLRAIDAAAADVVVRVTADCPLLSPTVSSEVLSAFGTDDDYASNTLERTYPRGLDTEVVRADALRAADAGGATAAEREHVTPFVWRRPERFRLRSVRAAVDRSALRWTVDTPEDLAFVQAVHAELGTGSFDMPEILALLAERPDLAALNASVPQKPIG